MRLKVATVIIRQCKDRVARDGQTRADIDEFLSPQPDPREVLRGKIKRTEHAADYIVMALNGRLVTAMNISTNGEQWFAFYPHRENGGDEFDAMAEAIMSGENYLIDRALETEGKGAGTPADNFQKKFPDSHDSCIDTLPPADTIECRRGTMRPANNQPGPQA